MAGKKSFAKFMLSFLFLSAIALFGFIFYKNFYTSITHNGMGYNTITSSSTGKVWLDRNIGATKQCTKSSLDIDCQGFKFKWGMEKPHVDEHTKKLLDSSAKVAESYGKNAGALFLTFGLLSGSSSSDWTNDDQNGSKREKMLMSTDGTGICPKGFRVPTNDDFERELSYRDVAKVMEELKLKTGDFWTSTPSGSSRAYLAYVYNGWGDDVYRINTRPRDFTNPIRCISAN